MSASQVDPHDKMRSRDVNKVAKGEQAPCPVHEPGTVSRPPPPKQVDEELSKSKVSAHSDDGKRGEPDKRSDDNEEEEEVVVLETAPLDMRFPFANQTRHCYVRYLEYHRCIQEKGKDAPECEKFAKYYRSLCPFEWIERWNEQREQGTFPGPIQGCSRGLVELVQSGNRCLVNRKSRAVEELGFKVVKKRSKSYCLRARVFDMPRAGSREV